MSDDDPFSATLTAAQAGADWALGELYREHHAGVLRYLRAMEPGEAEDLASEVWLAVADGMGRFQGDRGAFRAWIFTIARRRLIDFRRRRTRRATSPVPPDVLVERGRGGRRGTGGLGRSEHHGRPGQDRGPARRAGRGGPPARPGPGSTSLRWRGSWASGPEACAFSSIAP